METYENYLGKRKTSKKRFYAFLLDKKLENMIKF